ncbi:facilitated trehalose transporter Tret1-2 homolog isoform X2 [Toxorhynchites rutilus septentrionalis]|uniref:facilitated trehalose transporter Tret1-2 homolog isoform X2 n=1 Tax=Toxorhynchites rutilus septentrionalis TaxID=329112 RepID=UPI002478FDF9|nr:facilitated trehalose transporter Tret1-2 homolog isoform X2 [Toxorhynchites rutilus septentrionalis]
MCDYLGLSKSVSYQVLSTCIINIINLSHGAALGWVSPFLPLLQSDDSPLETGPISVEQGSWIGSILCLGGLAGAVIYGYLAATLGVKKSIICIIIPNMGFWLIVLFGTSVYHLYIARFLEGAAGCGVIVTFPLFIADISESRIRGVLGSVLALTGNSGILLMYIIGDCLPYRTVPLVMMTLPIAFLIAMNFIPETPQSLLRQRKIEDARRSLMFYRGVKHHPDNTAEIKLEFEQMKTFILAAKVDSHRISLKDFSSPAAIRGISVGIFLMFLNQFCGVFAILTYAVSIFSESGSKLDPGTSAIIMGAIQIFGTVASFIFIDLAGRKILLVVSTLGTGLGLTSLGMFAWLVSHGSDLSNFDWIPIVSLSATVFMFCVGLCSIPFFVLPEMLPAKICNAGNAISMIAVSIFSFITVKILPVLVEVIQLYGAVAIFAFICFLSIIIIVLFIPETKGKHLISPEIV